MKTHVQGFLLVPFSACIYSFFCILDHPDIVVFILRRFLNNVPVTHSSSCPDVE